MHCLLSVPVDECRPSSESPAGGGTLVARRLLVLAASALLAVGLAVVGQAQAPTEYEMKALFLYNFAKFVEWPRDAAGTTNAPFVIGVLGEDPFGDVLDETLRGKTVGGRTVVVRRFMRAKDARVCQMVFVSASEHRHLRSIFDSLRGAKVLTVGETPDFALQGGIINFTLQDNRVHFEINVEAAQSAGLKISSKLLSLARIVGANSFQGRE
jgi:hypothetical protein